MKKWNHYSLGFLEFASHLLHILRMSFPIGNWAPPRVRHKQAMKERGMRLRKDCILQHRALWRQSRRPRPHRSQKQRHSTWHRHRRNHHHHRRRCHHSLRQSRHFHRRKQTTLGWSQRSVNDAVWEDRRGRGSSSGWMKREEGSAAAYGSRRSCKWAGELSIESRGVE